MQEISQLITLIYWAARANRIIVATDVVGRVRVVLAGVLIRVKVDVQVDVHRTVIVLVAVDAAVIALEVVRRIAVVIALLGAPAAVADLARQDAEAHVEERVLVGAVDHVLVGAKEHVNLVVPPGVLHIPNQAVHVAAITNKETCYGYSIERC